MSSLECNGMLGSSSTRMKILNNSPNKDTKGIFTAFQCYVVWQNFILSFLHLHSCTKTLHSGISHSSCRLPQTNWQMVALWRGYCLWHYVKRVALDRVNHSEAHRRAQKHFVWVKNQRLSFILWSAYLGPIQWHCVCHMTDIHRVTAPS